MIESPWQFIAAVSLKPQGYVWRVRRVDGICGYFKFTTPSQWRFSGPMIANEWITWRLAERLGIPTATLEMATVRSPWGETPTGVVALVVDAKQCVSWHEVDPRVQQAPEPWLVNLTKLQQLVVFDAWIANTDRASGKNLIIYRDRAEESFNWYAIDHALALYGAPCKWDLAAWNEPFWQDLWGYYHVPHGLLGLQSDWSGLLPMVEQIERLSEADILDAVADAPPGTASAHLASFVVRLLECRRQTLRTMLTRWIDYDGVKEYQRASTCGTGTESTPAL